MNTPIGTQEPHWGDERVASSRVLGVGRWELYSLPDSSLRPAALHHEAAVAVECVGCGLVLGPFRPKCAHSPLLGCLCWGMCGVLGLPQSHCQNSGKVARAAALSMLAACCNAGTGESCLWLVVVRAAHVMWRWLPPWFLVVWCTFRRGSLGWQLPTLHVCVFPQRKHPATCNILAFAVLVGFGRGP